MIYAFAFHNAVWLFILIKSSLEIYNASAQVAPACL